MPTILVLVVLAQGPIQNQVTHEARALASQKNAGDQYGHWEERPIKSPTFVWIGIGLVAIGTVASILAVTSEQHSDLSHENINVRINRDLAPCGTDPAQTRLPIADCKPNFPLLGIGLGMQGAGAAMILYGSQPASYGPSLKFKVRF